MFWESLEQSWPTTQKKESHDFCSGFCWLVFDSWREHCLPRQELSFKLDMYVYLCTTLCLLPYYFCLYCFFKPIFRKWSIFVFLVLIVTTCYPNPSEDLKAEFSDKWKFSMFFFLGLGYHTQIFCVCIHLSEISIVSFFIAE